MGLVERAAFWRFLGELDNDCCWFSMPKNSLDFVFDDKDIITVFSNFGPNNMFISDLSLKTSAFFYIIDSIFFLSLTKDMRILNLLM